MSWKAARFLSGNGKQSAALAADRRHVAHGQFAIFLPIANLSMINDYSNSFHWGKRNREFSQGSFSAPGDLALQLDGWTTADFIRPTYQSSLHMAEMNFVWSNCCVACRPDSAIAWKRCEHCVCTEFLAGFTWAGLNEQANYNVIRCPGDPVSTYGISTMSCPLGDPQTSVH